MGKLTERLYNGIVKENPTFVQMLGMCPTLAVTTSAINGIGMGLATTVILTLSNLFISLLRKVIPDKVRIPAYIVIIASFVTIVQFVMEAFVPSLYASLGLFIPLIVVNCIILGRAEAYASKNKPLPSIFDGIGMGLGFTVGLTCIAMVRELLGSGSVFGFELFSTPISIFINPPGAFLVLAFLIAFLNYRNIKKAKKAGEKPELCKLADCANCQNHACAGKIGKED
ncbi:MAG: electron transport complex subunit E [Lachnospiraceae bacterium]|nr:electron transport complex subunit E [Lachnospiraceae bacterium]MBQ8318922.1 electron transport complex subunit E [Lachnospiraceae bacterium]